MRSLLDVKTEIATLREDCKYEKKLSKKNRMKKRILFLTLVQNYLESSPNELYLGREISRIENRINKIIDSFAYNPDLEDSEKKQKRAFEKEMGIPHLRVQMRTLRYIKK
jgi:hypothetical protein